MGKLHIHNTDIPQLSICNDLTCLLDHLVPRISISDSHHLILTGCQLLQLLCLFCGETERFFAHHMKSGLQRRLSDLIMRPVGCSHRHCLNPVFPHSLFCKHSLIIRIASVLTYMQLPAKCLSLLRIYIKSTCHQFKIKIPQCRGSVDITNLASSASSYHCPANRFFYSLFSVIHSLILLFLFIKSDIPHASNTQHSLLHHEDWYPNFSGPAPAPQ